MSPKDNKTSPIVLEHEEALKVYIDALLLEPAPIETVPDAAPPAPEPPPDAAPAVPVRAARDDGPFDCLQFKVAGSLSLAVPLVRLTGIMKWPGKLTPIPGHAEWFLGLVSHRGRQVKVIDIAKFVIPGNHTSRQVLAGERRFNHLLLIDEGRIGLACDALGRVLKLRADQVRWRTDTSRRPWLAGTLIEQMSALLDVDQLTAMLKEGVRADEIP